VEWVGVKRRIKRDAKEQFVRVRVVTTARGQNRRALALEGLALSVTLDPSLHTHPPHLAQDDTKLMTS
jgi:hypothetical protein